MICRQKVRISLMAVINLKLEYLTDKFLKDSNEANSKELLSEITHMIIEDAQVLIDGEKMADGQIDPAHIKVEIDHRYYFHVYTSKIAFDKCNGKNAYVIPLKSLLDPIFQNETFGGITLNYTKGKKVVLVSKEEIYGSLQDYLKKQTQ